jgi:20S proteasome alpha/beta subunit
MTLILGLRCTDGVVLGADGGFGPEPLGLRSVEPPGRALHVLGGHTVLAVAGDAGLGQRLAEEVEEAYRQGELPGPSRRHALWSLGARFREPLTAAAADARPFQKLLGKKVREAVLTQSLLAYPNAADFELVAFDHQGGYERVDEPSRFAALGGAHAVAHPFLSFLRRLLWEDRPPSVAEGTFAVTWALEHALATAPGRVTGPLRLVVLERNASGPAARALTGAELDEQRAAIRATEAQLRAFRRSQANIPLDALPPDAGGPVKS